MHIFIFVSLYRYIPSSGVIFLLSEGFSLAFLVMQVCWWWNLSAFVCLKSLFLKDIYTGYIILIWVFFFLFQYFKDVASCIPICIVSEKKVCCPLFLYSSVCNVAWYRGCFYSFLFTTGFNDFAMICMVFFMILFFELPGPVNI